MTPSNVTIIDGIRITIALFILVVSMSVLVYTYELERTDCKCALSPRIHFFRIVLIFQFVLIAVAIYRPLPSHTVGVFGFVWLLFVIYGLKFIRDMKSSGCTCSETSGRGMMERLLYGSIVLYAVFVGSLVAPLVISRK